jgi:NADP-dependent 3-hydroxy acid dehydrogenase YdfG
MLACGPSSKHSDPRVTPLALDVTSVDDIQRAAAQIGELDLLINNAGIAKYDDLTHSTLISHRRAF